jgi:hypothetical protein
MDERQHLGLARPQGRLDLGGIDGFAPCILDADHFRPGALGHFGHAHAEQAVDGDHGRVARLEQVEHGRFHPQRARPGKRDARMVRGAEDAGEAGLDLLHQRLESGVEVPDRGPRRGGQHARGNFGRSRTHQHPDRRLKTLQDGLLTRW